MKDSERLEKIRERRERLGHVEWLTDSNDTEEFRVFESPKTLVTWTAEEKADFIANAPDDISFLLDYIEFLSGLLSDRVQESELTRYGMMQEKERFIRIIGKCLKLCPKERRSFLEDVLEGERGT